MTMSITVDGTRELIPCKVEQTFPAVEWQSSWHLVRLKGLGAVQTSFLWKLVHRLLPVKERLHRLSPNISPQCSLCTQNCVEDLIHSFDNCEFSQGAGQILVNVLRDHLPDITMEKILRLEFQGVHADKEFPLVWFTAAFLLAIWDKRTSSKRFRIYEIRAEIEAKISLLRETRYERHVEQLKILGSFIDIE